MIDQEILDQIGKLFTLQQQTAFAIITLGVMGATQAFKNIYFGFYDVKKAEKRKAIIWLFAYSAGVAGGLMGHFTAEPPQPLWFWIFTGVTSGGAAIGLFKLFVEIILPRITGKKQDA